MCRGGGDAAQVIPGDDQVRRPGAQGRQPFQQRAPQFQAGRPNRDRCPYPPNRRSQGPLKVFLMPANQPQQTVYQSQQAAYQPQQPVYQTAAQIQEVQLTHSMVNQLDPQYQEAPQQGESYEYDTQGGRVPCHVCKRVYRKYRSLPLRLS